MTQQQENLSAFTDGECNGEHLISALSEDQALATKWQRYHLIRSTMRKELPAQLDFDLSDKIAAAIEQEPTVLSPRKRWQELPVVAQVIPLVKQGGQFAVAASVAAAMIIGVQQYSKPEAEEPFAVAPPFAGVQGGLAPVSLEQTRSVSQAELLEQRKRINAHLTDHRQQVRLKYALQSTPAAKQQEQAEQNLEQNPQ